MLDYLQKLPIEQVIAKAGPLMRNSDTQLECTEQLIHRLQRDADNNPSAIRSLLQIISLLAPPSESLTNSMMELCYLLPQHAPDIISVLSSIVQLPQDEQNLLSFFEDLLVTDRQYLLPIIGCLSSISLSTQAKNQVFQIMLKGMQIAEEGDLVVIVRGILTTCAKQHMTEACQKLREALSSVEISSSVSSLIIELIHHSVNKLSAKLCPLAQRYLEFIMESNENQILPIEIAILFTMIQIPKFGTQAWETLSKLFPSKVCKHSLHALFSSPPEFLLKNRCGVLIEFLSRYQILIRSHQNLNETLRDSLAHPSKLIKSLFISTPCSQMGIVQHLLSITLQQPTTYGEKTTLADAEEASQVIEDLCKDPSSSGMLLGTRNLYQLIVDLLFHPSSVSLDRRIYERLATGLVLLGQQSKSLQDMLLIFTQKQIFTGNRAKYLEKGVILATQLFANAALESEEFMRLLDWIIKMPLEFFHPTLLSVYQCIEISFSRLTRSDQENLLKFLKQILIKHSCFHQIECIFTEEFHLIPLEEENRLCSDPRDLDVWIQVERDSLEQDRFREIHEHAILGYFHCLASCFLQSYSLEQNKQMAKRFLNIPMIIPELLIEFLSGEWSPNSRTASLVLREYKLILLHSKTYLQALVLTAEMLWKDIPQEIILQVVSKIIHITHAIAILESFDKSSPIDSWNIPWNLLVPFCLTIDPQEILSCQHSGILQEKIAIELLMIHLKKCQLFSFAENSLLESQKIFEMLEWLMGIVLVRGKQISTLLHNDDSRENQVRDKNGLLVLFALELELLCHFIGISKGFPSGSLPCAWEELCKNLFAISENLKSDSELLWRFVQVQTLILSMKQSSLEAEELSRFENFIISGLESAYKPRRIATRAELAYFLLSENKNKASAWLKFSLSLLGSPEVSSINELTQAGVTPANSKLSKMFCIQTLMEILPEPSRKFAQSYSFLETISEVLECSSNTSWITPNCVELFWYAFVPLVGTSQSNLEVIFQSGLVLSKWISLLLQFNLPSLRIKILKLLLDHISVLLKIMRVVQISDTRDQQSALLLWKSGKVVYSYLQQCEEAIKQDSGISTERKLLPQIVLRATKLGDALRSFQQLALNDCSKSDLVFNNFENDYFVNLAKKTVGMKRQSPLSTQMHNPQPKRKGQGTIIGYTRKSFQDILAASPPCVSNFQNTLAADSSRQTIVIDFSAQKRNENKNTTNFVNK